MALRTLNDGLERVCSWIAAAATAVMAIVIPYEVLGRYVLGSMPSWSGELSCFALVWASMLGAAVGIRRGLHVGMESVIERLPAGAAAATRLVGSGVTLAILGVLTVYGVRQVAVNLKQLSPAMQIPMAIPYLAIPLGSIVMACFSIEKAIDMARGHTGSRQGLG